MGSSLSRVFTKHIYSIRGKAIKTSKIKPIGCYRYIDDRFVKYILGHKALDNFLKRLNRQYKNIRFRMEKEENKYLPFLDELVRGHSEKLTHTGYSKKKNTS